MYPGVLHITRTDSGINSVEDLKVKHFTLPKGNAVEK